MMEPWLFLFATLGWFFLAAGVVALFAAGLLHFRARRDGTDITTYDGPRYRLDRYDAKDRP